MGVKHAEHLQLLQAALASSSDGVVIADAEGRLIFINETARRLVRQAPTSTYQSVQQTTEFDLRYADGRPVPAQESPLQRALRGEATVDSLLALGKPDGIGSYVSITAHPAYDEQDRLIGVVSICRDATERVLEEKHSAEMAERLRAANEQLVLSAIRVQENLEHEQMLREDLQAQSEEVQAQQEELLVLNQELQEAHDELEMRVAERTAELARANADLRAEVDERKRAQEALRESEESYRTLVESIDDVVVVKDAEGRYALVNAAALRVLDLPKGEIIGKTARDLYPPEIAETIIGEERRVFEEGVTINTEIERTTEQGHRVYHARRVPLRNTVDDIVGIVTVGRDITELNLAAERIRQEAARAQVLLRVAAHLNSQLDLDAVLRTVCEEAAHTLNAPAAGVRLYDAESRMLRLVADYGMSPAYCDSVLDLPKAFFDEHGSWQGSCLVIPDVGIIPEMLRARASSGFDIRTLAAAEMRREADLVGVLTIASVGQTRDFADEDLDLLRGLADQAALAIANARSYQRAERQIKRIEALRNIDMAITGSVDLRVTLNVFLEQVTSQLGVDAAAVLLFNPHSQVLEYGAGRGFRTRGIERSRLRLGEGFAGQVALERRPIVIPDLTSPSIFSHAPLVEGEGFVSYHGAPLIAKGHIKGVLEIFHRSPSTHNGEWLSFLEALAGQAAIAIDNAALFDDLQRSNAALTLAYDTTIEGWSRALDLRDKETEGHSLRVTELTVRLGKALGMSDAELVHVRRGALLHDIGKMGIPDSILLKPGPLTEEEWGIMRRHPVYTYELLSPIAYLRPALDIPYYHHEKWDGTGYPQGVNGEQIPLAARIFALADVWDALHSDRPYRPAWSEDEARAYLCEQMGKHFDPRVVEAFSKLEVRP